MVNVAKNLNFKVKYCDLNFENGFIDINKLKSLISKKTAAVGLPICLILTKIQKKLEKLQISLKWI